VLTIDPATLLPTGEVVENGLSQTAMARMTEIEIREEDFNKFAQLSLGRRPAASLSGATDGNLARSLRQRELRRPEGFEDELRAALVSEAGTWGALTLLRETGRPHFTHGEVRSIASVSRYLAEGLRRAILLAAVSRDANQRAAGLLVLAEDNSIESANAAALLWLDELGGVSGRLPIVIHAVASRARSILAGQESIDAIARARVRTRSGLWLLVRGSLLDEEPQARAAVLLEPPGPPDLAPLIADAYGLTPRERAVTQLIAQGNSTTQISDRLHLSPYTVQDHLKAIFEKVGVGTRGELVARLFFDHYAPRLTDGAPVDATGAFADPTSQVR
jgi:DNA-binding CsgD family transcriptional regulator